jgi:hypothetical protein
MILANNNINSNYQTQGSAVETQSRFNVDMRGQFAQQNAGWKNVKSPRSPQIDNQTYNQPNANRNCFNHTGKRAEYMAETDGEVIYYCETCAAKLAAQRF